MGRGIMTGNDNEGGGVKHRVVAVCSAGLVLLYIFDVYRGKKMPLPQNMNITKSLRSIMFLVMKILMRLPASFYLLKSSHLLQFSP